MTDEPIIDPAALKVTRWKLDITNRVDPYAGLELRPTKDVTFEGRFEIDSDTYARIVGQHPAPLYTVQHTVDHNPWHRTAAGLRARARKLRDGIWWTFQRRVLRRSLAGSTTITVPNCRIEVEQP